MRHGFAIPGPEGAHFLNIHAPGGFERFFEELGKAAADGFAAVDLAVGGDPFTRADDEAITHHELLEWREPVAGNSHSDDHRSDYDRGSQRSRRPSL